MPSWKCNYQKICAVCKEHGHIPGYSECNLYTENNNAYTLVGRSQPLGLSNFDHCKF